MDKGSVVIQASKLELVVDDDEQLNSFYAKADKPRAYLALARSASDSEVYCEYNDQSRGFRSRTVSYELQDRIVKVQVRAPEAFDAGRQLRCIELKLPPRAHLGEVQACLQAVFKQP